MDKAIGILHSLGVDSTIGYQVVIFLVTFVILQWLMFGPYFKAFLERQSRTTGSHEAAGELTVQAQQLELVYQQKTRSLNQETKNVFDKERAKAMKEQERILNIAREKAKESVDSARATIQQEYVRAREELLKDSKAMGQAMASQLLVKE